MSGTNGNANDTVQVVTEQDLLKSLQALEAKTGKEKPPEPPLPQVVQVELAKSTGATVRETANTGTKRALDVSDVLSDIVDRMGEHNDAALTTMLKSINSGAERDLAMVKVICDLKKSIDALAEKVEKYGQTPRPPRTPGREEVLHKGGAGGAVNGSANGSLDPRTAKRAITQGLEILTKSLDPKDPKQQQRIGELTMAAIKFEATGQIDERYIAAAQKALKEPA